MVIVLTQEKSQKSKKLIGNFDVVVNKFSVKNPYVSCSKYELNYGIFDDLFDEKKKERGKRTT